MTPHTPSTQPQIAHPACNAPQGMLHAPSRAASRIPVTARCHTLPIKAPCLPPAAGPSRAAEGAISIVSDEQGVGQHEASAGDLVLVHYTGRLAKSGDVFDSTRGGLVGGCGAGARCFKCAVCLCTQCPPAAGHAMPRCAWLAGCSCITTLHEVLAAPAPPHPFNLANPTAGVPRWWQRCQPASSHQDRRLPSARWV